MVWGGQTMVDIKQLHHIFIKSIVKFFSLISGYCFRDPKLHEQLYTAHKGYNIIMSTIALYLSHRIILLMHANLKKGFTNSRGFLVLTRNRLNKFTEVIYDGEDKTVPLIRFVSKRSHKVYSEMIPGRYHWHWVKFWCSSFDLLSHPLTYVALLHLLTASKYS